MVKDQPVIQYDVKDNKKGQGASREEMDAIADAWFEKNGGETLVGKTFSLNDFMAGKI